MPNARDKEKAHTYPVEGEMRAGGRGGVTLWDIFLLCWGLSSVRW